MPRPVAKARPRRERAMLLLQPIADLLVRWLARRGVDPLGVLAAHAVAGLTAAAALAWGGARPHDAVWAWSAAAGLLLLRAVLDNVDGGLARATGRVTRTGRYADTASDLIVNLALFSALATVVPWGVAVAAFFVNTVLLSLDANLERLYRLPRTAPDRSASDPPDGGPAWALRLSEGLYRAVLAPQDRAIERWDRALFRRVEGAAYAQAPLDRRLAWSDLFSTASLVDVGLSTQSLLLAALLLAGRPEAFPVLIAVAAAWAAVAQGLRVVRYRRYRQRAGGDPGRPAPDGCGPA